MKIIGAIIILLATTWTGFEVSKSLSERPRQLRLLKTALQSLEAEIMFSHTPLRDASMHIARQLPRPLSWLFDCFSKRLGDQHVSASIAWNDSLDDIWRHTALKDNEREILKQFGETLGQHDLFSQQKHIHLAISHLEREEQDAKDKQLRYEKMMKSLGVLTGLLLIILLM
ncbi:stage III sporulation protein SpoAB [Bacillus sp. HMF5848]|uniref:stage III sporulation protein SpoIIIAB n=1 Tax=Bacillus sp. HMF5848 TaxID=2495421 RepID=UPI000F7817E9|nr:stage III sporulation protein SpoIIIAB [Bacillus sp. HMF5848]RSK27805.1 stage III sporulation protein SpoAB [Bacillus sp. HMF5848]